MAAKAPLSEQYPLGTEVKVLQVGHPLYGETGWVVLHDDNYIEIKIRTGASQYLNLKQHLPTKTKAQTRSPF